MPRHGTELDLATSPVLREAVLDAVGAGVPLSVALQRAGYNPRIVADWAVAAETGIWRKSGHVVPEQTLEVIGGFLERLRVLLAKQEAELVESIRAAGNVVNEKTGQKDWRAHAWLLEHGPTRANWRAEKGVMMDVTHSRTVPPEFREAREMSTDELLEGADPEWQALLGEGR